jgi:hypothetical protein
MSNMMHTMMGQTCAAISDRYVDASGSTRMMQRLYAVPMSCDEMATARRQWARPTISRRQQQSVMRLSH